jgi:hypothetical protein
VSFLRHARARDDTRDPPQEAFTRSLLTGRLARRSIALGLAALGIAVAWISNAVATPVGVGAGIAVTAGLVVALIALDGPRWRAQDVVLWQQAARNRRWREDTGGASPTQHPAQAELWLGSHPRGSVPQVYRVMAASLAGDVVAHERELRAWNPATATETAWKAWATVAPRAMNGEDVDLGEVRDAVGAVPAEERRDLEAGLAVAEALRRHHTGDDGWLLPLVQAREWIHREHVGLVPRFRLLLNRVLIVGSFLIPAVALAWSGVGTPEPFPRAYLSTNIATRGDIGRIDQVRLLRALPGLAREVATSAPLRDVPTGVDELNRRISGALPTLIWEVDRIDLDGPDGVRCDHVWSIESLLGDAADGPMAIVTCDRRGGPAYLVPVDPATATEIEAALGVGAAGDGS